MKEIIYNDDNLKESQITDIVKKVKILLINSNNEILLGYSYGDYQFPGGTNEKGETLIETVNREIKEETGIELNVNIDPFLASSGYYKDWPEIGRNKKVEIYYYKVICDEKPKLDKLNLTENEINGNFHLKYISLDKIEKVIKKNMELSGDQKGIGKEMLEVLNEYRKRRE